MPFLTPFGFGGVLDTGSGVNYYRFPLDHSVRYTNGGGGSSGAVNFRGHVEVFESGTVRLDGWVINYHADTDHEYQVWVGASDTVGAWHTALKVPYGGDWVRLDFAIAPDPGEKVMLSAGDTGDNTSSPLVPVDCFSYSDGGWKNTIAYTIVWDTSPYPPTTDSGSIVGSLYRVGNDFHNDFTYDDASSVGTVGIQVDGHHDSSDPDPRNWTFSGNATNLNQLAGATKTTQLTTVDLATQGYFFYCQLAKSGINIAREQLALGPFPRSAYAPTVQSKPDPAADVSNYIDVPINHGYYDRDLAASGYTRIVFQGTVRVFESGTMQFIGQLTNNDNRTTDRPYMVWVGSSKTVGAFRSLGISRYDGTAVPVNETIIPCTGEEVYFQFGVGESNSSGWTDFVKVLEYPTSGADPWNFPIQMNASFDRTSETIGDRLQQVITRNGTTSLDIQNDLVTSSAQGILYTVELNGSTWVGANFQTTWQSFSTNSTLSNRSIPAGAFDGLKIMGRLATSGINSIAGPGDIGPIMREVSYGISTGYDPAVSGPLGAKMTSFEGLTTIQSSVAIVPFFAATDTMDIVFRNTGEEVINFVSVTKDPSYSQAFTFGGGLASTLDAKTEGTTVLTIDTTAGLTYSRAIITYNVNGGPNQEFYLDFGV